MAEIVSTTRTSESVLLLVSASQAMEILSPGVTCGTTSTSASGGSVEPVAADATDDVVWLGGIALEPSANAGPVTASAAIPVKPTSNMRIIFAPLPPQRVPQSRL